MQFISHMQKNITMANLLKIAIAVSLEHRSGIKQNLLSSIYISVTVIVFCDTIRDCLHLYKGI